MAEGWRSVRLDEIEPIAVVGKLLWRPVRRTLDIGAFGINAYVAPNAGDDVVEEHTESSLGHEELYVVLSGRATFTLDDETLDAPAGHGRLHPRPGREAPRPRRGAGHGRARRRRPPRRARTSRRRGSTASRPSGIAPPGDYEAMAPRSRRRSSSTPITRRCSTTSPARRRSRAGRTTRSRTCGAHSSSGRSGPTTCGRTRTSPRCASYPAGR